SDTSQQQAHIDAASCVAFQSKQEAAGRYEVSGGDEHGAARAADCSEQRDVERIAAPACITGGDAYLRCAGGRQGRVVPRACRGATNLALPVREEYLLQMGHDRTFHAHVYIAPRLGLARQALAGRAGWVPRTEVDAGDEADASGDDQQLAVIAQVKGAIQRAPPKAHRVVFAQRNTGLLQTAEIVGRSAQ